MKKQEFQLEALNPSNTYLLLRLQMEYTALYKMWGLAGDTDSIWNGQIIPFRFRSKKTNSRIWIIKGHEQPWLL